MKILLLLSFLFTFSFSMPMQVIVGSCTQEENAQKIYQKLQKYVNNQKDFFESNSIISKYKKSQDYFVVTLQPIYEHKILFATLAKIKKEFPGAYTLDLHIPLDQLETAAGVETKENTSTTEEQNVQKQVKRDINISEKKTQTNTQGRKMDASLNILVNFKYEIIAVILFIVILIIALLSTKEKKTISKEAKEIHEIVLEKEEAQKVPLAEENTSDDFDGKEEGSFDTDHQQTSLVSDVAQTEKSKIKKRDVPPHGKITKQNFKEFSGLRLLVAEDNVINQKVITGLLAGTGIEIVIANDGQDALDILEEDSNFPIIIMDVHMPRMDGFEATRHIKANPKYEHIVVVALSGDTAADDIKVMMASGMQEHLEKPLRMDSLYDVLYAYTGEEESNHHEFINVIYTKELNGDKGLEVCGGDEEFYRDILHEFVHTYENSTDELDNLLHAEKLYEADQLLLDIIGITANIGADNLNFIAHDIKEALKDVDEKSYLTLAGQYKEHLQELIKDIKEYL